MKRYFIGFIIAIGLIVLLIVLIFSGNGNKSKTVVTPKTLQSYANTDASVRLTIDGPITAPQNHNQVQITISRDDAQFSLIQGYDGAVVNSQTFANTENSYNAFLHALEHGGFTEGTASTSLADDSGYCATGDRYIFELLDANNNDLERYWSTSCPNTPKTFNGNLNLNLTLFQRQIPGYSGFTNSANI